MKAVILKSLTLTIFALVFATAAASAAQLEDIEYDSIRIGVKIGGTVFYQISVDETIRMTLPADTTLYAQIRQSNDHTNWVDAPVNWTFERIGTDGAAPPPATGPSYTFRPTAPVIIRVTATTTTGVTSSPVRIRAEYGAPAAMRFFSKSGAPTDLSNSNIMTEYPHKPADRPAAQKIYPVPTETLTVTAGDTLPIVAAMFSTNPPALNSYIPNMSLPGTFTWVIENNTDGSATRITQSTSGYEAMFRSTAAHKTHTVLVTYTNGMATPVTQRLLIKVNPGDPAAVYIEPVSQELNPMSLNKPLRFDGKVPQVDADGAIVLVNDTLTMTSAETSRIVYALLRDKWGNYVAPSGGPNPYWPTFVEPNATTWSPSPPTTVAAAGSNPSIGQGIVTKDTSARTPWDLPVISARENTFIITQNPATLRVKILGYSYTELKVTEEGGNHFDGGTLKITTNDEPTVVVWGKRSDCDKPTGPTGDGCWEKVPGSWGSDGDLPNSLINPPSSNSSWKLDPRNPGNGIISVSRQGVDENGTPVTIKVDVPVVIELGPPTRAELIILVPPNYIKAGYPIKVEARYFNRTGEMTSWDPSWTSTGTAFADDKGVGNTNKAPTVASKGKDTTTLWNPNNPKNGSNAKLVPGDNTGKDTVTLKLYNATNANPHTISYVDTIVVNGVKSPVSATAALTLLSGDPAKVVIVDGGGNPVKDSISIPYDGGNTIMQTVGEDEWGNRTGDQGSTWCVNGAIPTIGNSVCTGEMPLIIYDTDRADQNGCGWIVATPPAGIKADSVYTCITGIKLAASDAITQDNHGCGYINAIKMRFPKKVELVTPYSESQHSSLITIVGPSQNLYVSGIVIDRTDSTIVTLEINETRSSKAGIFQTGWKPKLTIAAGILKLKGSNPKVDVDFTIQAVRDGAAPVITKAERFFDESGDKKKDRIVLHFSEPIQSINGIFTATEANRYKPDSLFRVWESDVGYCGSGGFGGAGYLSKSASVDDCKYFDISSRALAGLSKVNLSGETLWFALETEFDIKPGHFISMNAKAGAPPVTRCAIRDRMSPQNVPDTNNRRTPVVYGNDPPGTIEYETKEYKRLITYTDSVILSRTNGSRQNARASVAASVDLFSGQFTAGPNPIGRGCGKVGFFRLGGEVKNGKLQVYDLLGNLINSIEIRDSADGNLGRRRVGSWDLTDRDGRPVTEGAYLVRGVLAQKDGGKVRVSIVVNVNNQIRAGR